MLKQLYQDEQGVIISAELVLVCTILVLGLTVGMVELQCAIADELNDLGEAFGSLNQSYHISGMLAPKSGGYKSSPKAWIAGSSFKDGQDSCDGNECEIVCSFAPRDEAKKGGHYTP